MTDPDANCFGNNLKCSEAVNSAKICAEANTNTEKLKKIQRKAATICNDCDTKFSSGAELREHRKALNHTSRKTKRHWKCEVCNAEINASSENIRRHQKLHLQHAGGPGHCWTCDECGAEISDFVNFRNHQKLHRLVYFCQDCGRGFTLAVHLRDHILTSHSDTASTENDPFPCVTCGEAFPSRYRLIRHRIMAHMTPDAARQRMARWKRNRDLSEMDLPYVCSTCNRRFAANHNLLRHLVCHGQQEHNEMGIVKDASSTKLFYSCPICSKLVSRRSLNQHMRVHSDARGFKCEPCNKYYKSKMNLRLHIRCVHQKIRRYVCSTCGATFRSYSGHRDHERAHAGVRLYTCSFCAKKLSNRKRLADHERIHTGAKPFFCEVCGKNFRESSHLRRHALLHLANRPFYYCTLCDNKYCNKTDLKLHAERVHYMKLDSKQCRLSTDRLAVNNVENGSKL